MKKIFYILFIGLLVSFMSCNINPGTEGWYIDNESSKDVIVCFDDVPFTVQSNYTSYIHDISVKANITIADSYNVTYEVTYHYSTSNAPAKKLIIKDKI
jgi:hypothetical protein